MYLNSAITTLDGQLENMKFYSFSSFQYRHGRCFAGDFSRYETVT